MRPTEVIKIAVCDVFGVSLPDLLGPRRSLDVARPRMAAMYVAKRKTALSLPQIGRAFNRDHTTVMHACEAMPRILAADPWLAAKVEEIEADLPDLAPIQEPFPIYRPRADQLARDLAEARAVIAYLRAENARLRAQPTIFDPAELPTKPAVQYDWRKHGALR